MASSVRTLYLHGFASSPETSSKAGFLTDLFARRQEELVKVDLVPGDFYDLTISGMLEEIGKAAGDEPCRIIGSSLGGLLAAQFAAREPEQVERMVLLCPAFGFPRRWAESMGEEAVEQWRAKGSYTVFHHAEGREREVGFQFYEDAQQHPPEPEFTQPAVVIHGTADETVPIDYSRRFAVDREHVELIEVEDDHSLHGEAANTALVAAL